MPIKDVLYHSQSRITQAEDASTESSETITRSAPVAMMSAGQVEAMAVPTSPEIGLLARWICDEGSGTTLGDSSGNGYDGTFVNAVGWSAEVPNNSYTSSLDFGDSNTNKYVNLPTNINPTGNEITLVAWARASGIGWNVNNYDRILSKATGNSSDAHYYMLGGSSNTTTRGRLRTGGIVTTIYNNTVRDVDVWYLMAVGLDSSAGGNLYAALNGVYATNNPTPGDITTGDGVATWIGANPGSVSDFWKGQLADIRIYERFLSEEDLLAIYNNTEVWPPPPGGDLEGDDLNSTGKVQSGAATAAYTLDGEDLDSVGTIQSGATTAAYTLEGDDLNSTGTIQSGEIAAAYTLTGDDLDSVGTIQSGETTAAYTLEGDDLDSVGTIQSGEVSPPPGADLEGDDLNSTGKVQSGAIHSALSLEGGSLNSTGKVQSGSIRSAFSLEGGGLDSTGAIQSGETSIVLALQGTGLSSTGEVQSGALGVFSYTLEGDSLNSVGEVKSGATSNAAGAPVGTYDIVVRVYNDVGYKDSASFTWEVQEELLPPQWQTVPDRSDRIDILPQPYDMRFYVSSNAGLRILWRLASSPSGFSIDGDTGVITGSASAGVGDHSLRVGVSNSQGEELSNTFTWTILEELLPPQWGPIPDKTTAYEDLPDTYDVSSYVSSNSGPLDTWSLVAPPAGFSIDQSGFITAATDAVQADNSITVRVFNDEDSADKTFTWTVDAPLVSGYFHEFNAALGGFTLLRDSDATVVEHDNPNSFITVGVDLPVYTDCDWNGSVFVPTVGFTGLFMECGSTNYLLNSQDINSTPWVDNAGNAVDSNTWTNTADNGGIYQLVPNFGDGDVMLMSAYFREDPDGSIYWNWYSVNDSEITFPVFGGTDWEYWAMSPTCGSNGTPRWIVGAVDAGAGNSYGMTHAQAEDDDLKLAGTSIIICPSTTVLSSRAAAYATATTAALGVDTPGFFDDYAGQLKVTFYQEIKSGSYFQHFFGIFSPGSADYPILISRRGTPSKQWALYTRDTSGETAYSVTNPLVPGAQVDFRWKTEPNNKMKIWVDGVLEVTDVNNTAGWSSAPVDVSMGAFTADPNAVPQCSIHTVRLVQGPISDAEVEAWT